ncbi:hypothetical protein Tco_0508467 [Tanacetum coccineum]
MCLLYNKVNQLKPSITKHVSDSIQSIMPLIVTNTLKEQLPGLLSDALKDTLPQLLKDSIKSSVSESIAEELPQFNAFNKLESQRFVLLQKELSKSLHNKMRKSIRLEGEKWEKNNPESLAEEKDAQCLDQTNGEQDSGATTISIVQGEKPSAQVIPNARQAPLVNEKKALVLLTLEEKSSEEDTSGKKEIDNKPLAKKPMFLILSSSIPSPTHLKSIMPEHPKYIEAVKMTLAQFTEHLSKTTSSIFSHTPPRELTSPRDESKGKGIATEEPLKEFMPFMEEGGSVPKISSLKSFVIPEGPLSKEKFMAQLKEMKRLADLKAEKEKSKKLLKKILNLATIRA